ncbi:MAG: DNA polymerase IV [Anaerococcus sp.]|uniref:DNA polymerase IV n=1 Tax=Anaerococcus sp. TaxID=1872515 RepID=UPI00260CDDE0|nr:DNA polymerase IV [Anaerococcus sp.]MCI5972438.1 DNA polymerase IV [Anaerococcus sp.]MDD6918631.1 DNA polymerase IV [Peptoniphilaceae bacterium]MDY2928021.1 DNA polymerase IV [Anaerococcus sp.]
MNYIFHVDCDAFYASCEELRNPKLKNHPLAVGGLSNKSILTTANYKAREFGLHSAMPVFMAKELCPNLILLPVDHKYYREKSKEVFSLVKEYAKLIEQVSVDEAYLLVETDSAKDLARNLQEKVLEKTGIGISIGISYNKFLAKLASDWKKPQGITQIRKEDLEYFLPDIPVKKVHGIGKKTSERLNKIGIYKVEDLLKLDYEYLIDNFGKQGAYIYHVIRGVDERKINPYRVRKSIGKERTFAQNTNDMAILSSYLKNLSELIEDEMDIKNIHGKTVNLKIKDHKFKNHTKAITLQEPIYKARDIYNEALSLLKDLHKGEMLRLIGISLSNLQERKQNQLSFFD